MKIYYMTDMHLDFRISEALKGSNPAQANEIASETIVKFVDLMFKDKSFSKEDVLLLGGDVSPWAAVNKWFYILVAQKFPGHIIAVLGNHDVWGWETLTFESTAYPITTIIDEQLKDAECDKIMKAPGDFVLIQNELAYLPTGGKHLNVLSEETICETRDDELREIIGNSPLIVLGGLGFSGYNLRFNASQGIYRRALTSFRGDRILSDIFYEVYKKVAFVFPEKPIICLTHTPMTDWCKEPTYLPSWYYVAGHTHQNRLTVNDEKKLYYDGQVGYYGWDLKLKHFDI